MTLILIFGLALVGVGVDAEADPGTFDEDPDTEGILVLTLGKDGVEGGGGAIFDDGDAPDNPPGSGFLSPAEGRGFRTGFATMLSERPPPGEEESLSLW